MTDNNYQQNSVLHINGLSYQRDWKIIINNFNLTVNPGELIIIRGQNGCGKTTLLKLSAGILKPTTGHIILAKTYSYLGHANGIKSTQTLNGIIYSLDKSAQQTANAFVCRLGMENYTDAPFYQLSAGLKRRVALIQMLASRADLYIADEPLDHIDQVTCQLIWKIFAEKVQEGAAILMSHHSSNPFNHNSTKEVTLNE